MTSFRPLLTAAIFAAAASQGGAAFAQADLASGQKLFQQRCAICHSVKASEKKPTGPDLENIVGRKSASADFSYSAGMKGANIVWSEKTLDGYLAAPDKVVAGTTMPVGVPQAADREDIIAYLKSISK